MRRRYGAAIASITILVSIRLEFQEMQEIGSVDYSYPLMHFQGREMTAVACDKEVGTGFHRARQDTVVRRIGPDDRRD